MKSKLIAVYWRDIPAQVIAKRGRETAKVQLPERFQVAIDRAAMRAGKGSSDKYLDDWRRQARGCGEDLSAEAQAEADRLIASFSTERLERVVKNGGLDPERGDEGQDNQQALSP